MTMRMAPDDEWRSREVPIREDMAFQRLDWHAHRIGWLFLLVSVVAGAFGLFAVGPISDATAVGADRRLTIDYQRFMRNDAAAAMTVRVSPEPGSSQVHLIIGAEWIATFAIEAMQPRPSASFSEGGDIHLLFIATGTPLTARFTVRPNSWGKASGRVALADGESVRITQIVYP